MKGCRKIDIQLIMNDGHFHDRHKGLCAKLLCSNAVQVIFTCDTAQTVQISHKQGYSKSILVYGSSMSITT